MNDIIAKIVPIDCIGRNFTNEEISQINALLDNIICDVFKSEGFESAKQSLDKLAWLQTELARACFKWHIKLPDNLYQLVSDFDQCEDVQLRHFVYGKIKMGKFLSMKE